MVANTKKMLLAAQKGGYAVPAFNVHNLNNMRACVEEAARLRSPVILACTPKSFAFSGTTTLLAVANALSDKYDIPVALHMDHHHTFGEIKRGIDAGIKSAMIDASLLPFADNVALTQKVVAYARRRDVTVEAELGVIHGTKDDVVTKAQHNGEPTPEQVVRFCTATKVDSLAVAIGTAHGVYEKTPVLDLKRLAAIAKVSPVPLVLHGSSGLTLQQVRACVKAGVHKVNVGTDLKAPYARAVRDFWAKHPSDGDPRHFVPPGVDAIKKVVRDKIHMCMSDNRY